MKINNCDKIVTTNHNEEKNIMENRINSLETELALLKEKMSTCQSGLLKDIETLRNRKPDLPVWIKTASLAIVISVFGQTVSAVWWASTITARQEAMQYSVNKNTKFVEDWPKLHEEVMVGLQAIKSDNNAIKDAISEVKETLRLSRSIHERDD